MATPTIKIVPPTKAPPNPWNSIAQTVSGLTALLSCLVFTFLVIRGGMNQSAIIAFVLCIICSTINSFFTFSMLTTSLNFNKTK